MPLWMLICLSMLNYLSNYWIDCCEILYRHSWWNFMTAVTPSLPLAQPTSQQVFLTCSVKYLYTSVFQEENKLHFLFPNSLSFHFRWRFTFYLGIFIYGIRHLWVVSCICMLIAVAQYWNCCTERCFCCSNMHILLVSVSRLGCGTPESVGTTTLSRLVVFVWTAQSSYSAAFTMTLICAAPYCWQASGATYLLKVFLFDSLQKPLSPEQYNHYAAELAFYWSLMFSQFIDIKRKVSHQQLN